MATYTLANLRTLAKQESDNVNQSFISDAEFNRYIQGSYNELFGLIVEAYGDDYFVQTPSAGYQFTTDGVNNRYALPAAFFKLRGVDLQVQTPNQWTTLKPFTMAERNRLSGQNSNIPMAGQVLQVLYTPLPTLPAQDADTIDGVNGWEEYVIIDAAMKALAKEEADVSVLMARKQAMIRRLEAETQNRDSGMPHHIADTLFRARNGMRYRLDGGNIWLVGNSTGPQGDWDEYGNGNGMWP